MGKEIDPSDIGKYPEIIKKAQSEMTNMDVLVCGHCNDVFHFVEQFREHKMTRCVKTSTLKENLETKPVIWSFLLWKSSQLNSDQAKDSTNVNAWRLYQSWMKLDESVKETWVVAGGTIQSFAKIGQGALQEMPVKITKTVVDNSVSEPVRPTVGRQIVTNRVVNKPTVSQKDLDASFNELKSSENTQVKRQIIRSPPVKNVANRVGSVAAGVANVSSTKPGFIVRTAWRTVTNNANGVQRKEHTIEKILAKRYNPRYKEHEYLIKWENVSQELNTWEPASHLSTCPVLLDTFEKQLARQKEQRLALAAKQQAQAQAQAQAEAEIKNDVNDSQSSQSEDDSSASGVKRRKLETVPFKVSVNKVEPSTPAAPPASNITRTTQVNKAKPNGLQPVSTTINKSNEKSAEVVITSAKDGKQTGIVKKAGVPVNPIPKNEAQIKVIQKGGDSVSGVVRLSNATTTINQTTTRPVQKLGNTIVKSVQGVARASTAKLQPKMTSVPAAPARAQSVHQLNTTVTQKGGVQSVSKPTITRVIKSAPNSKSTTPEQKIAALTRHGNLKITRKSANIQPANAQPILIQGDEEFNLHDSFATNIVPKVEAQEQHLPLVSNQLLGQDLTLIDASQHNQNASEIKKENEDIVMAEEQLQQLQQTAGLVTDQEGLQQILATNDDGSQQLIQFVTGEDGTIYQVAGKNEQGQTILIAQGADGEQQCVYVAAEDSDALGLDDTNNGVLSIDGNLVDANSADVQQQLQQQLVTEGQQGIQYAIEDDNGTVENVQQPLAVTTEDTDSQDGQITAEVVQADLPSPGGTRRVVLQLPDGTFMVTEVDEEQFKALHMQP